MMELDVISLVTLRTISPNMANEQSRVLNVNIILTSWKLAIKANIEMKRRKQQPMK